LINNSGGIIDHVDYSAFGTVLDESSPTSGDRMMGFAALQRDKVTGLNVAVNRVEDPGTGRWDSQDPLGFASGDTNDFRYVSNDPVAFTDALGLQKVTGRKADDGDFKPTGPLKGFLPTGDELRNPKLFPNIKKKMDEMRQQSADDPALRERGCVVFMNESSGFFRIVDAPIGGPFGINFNPVLKPGPNWVAVCTIHTHPPNPKGKPDPKDSPRDPRNSNRGFGSNRPTPWLVVGPDGKIYLIGPDKRGGKPNQTSR
jgi:RHS repeat-associated protein